MFTIFWCTPDFVYCHDIWGLITALEAPYYDSKEWHLFLDSSKQNLKCDLLHNANIFSAKPIRNSVKLKEKYENIQKRFGTT